MLNQDGKRSASRNCLFPDWPYLEKPTRYRGTSTAKQPQPHRGTVNRPPAIRCTVRPPPQKLLRGPYRPLSRQPLPDARQRPYSPSEDRRTAADHHQSAEQPRKGRLPASRPLTGRDPLTTRKAAPVRPSLTRQAVAASRRSPSRQKQAGSLHRARGPYFLPGKAPRARTRDRNFSGSGQENADLAGVEKSRHLRRSGNCLIIWLECLNCLNIQTLSAGSWRLADSHRKQTASQTGRPQATSQTGRQIPEKHTGRQASQTQVRSALRVSSHKK